MFQLGINTQQLFRQWHELEPDSSGRPPFRHTFRPSSLNTMVADYPDDEALREQMRNELRAAEAMAVVLFHRAAEALPEPPPPDRAVNPYAVSLRPENWEADGLYGSGGLTLEQALHDVPEGFERIWDDPTAGPPGKPPATARANS